MVTAFLTGKLDEKVVMRLLKFLYQIFREYVRVLKSLYNLKQATRVWWKVLKSYLEEISFTSLATDETVMTNRNLIMTNGKALVVIGIYVDNILITEEDDKEINKVAELLKGRFEMKDLGDAQNILGIQIQQKGNKLSIDQSTYAVQIVKEFLYKGLKMFATLMATNTVKVLATDPGNQLDEKETTMFL